MSIPHKKKEKEKQFEDEEYIRRRISEILKNWDEIKRNYILLWLGLNIAAFIMGFSSFIHLLYILGSAFSATIVYISIFIWVVLAASLCVICSLYKKKFTKYITYRATRDETSAPLITYMVGLLFTPLYFGVMSSRELMISVALLAVVLIIFYLMINPWRGLNDIKMKLEENLLL